MVIMVIYLIVTGIAGSIFLIADKEKAIARKYRIPEKTLHIFEAAGGVFIMLPMMHIIRHKNKKFLFF